MGSEVNPAVVLGLSPTGLGIIRALSRKGIRVIGIDRNPWAIGNFTRYGDRKIILSEHNWEESLLKLLLEISKNYNEKPVLFCAEDLFLAFTAKFANHLKNSYLMPNSFNHNTIDLFLNKERFYRTCLDAGIETPNTYFPKNEEDIIEISNEVQYPCIIKPTYSHLWRRKLRGNKVVEVQSSRDLLFKYKLMTSLGDGLMVQEVIPGLDNCIHLCEGYFDQNSEPLAIFTGRKIRQFPPYYGSTSFAESLWKPEIADLSIDLMKRFNVDGISGPEYKWDRRDGVYKLIEVNFRRQLWSSLTDASGVDSVHAAYLDLIGSPVPSYHQTDGVRWAYFSRDLLTSFHYLRHKDISLKEWAQSLRNIKGYAIYARDDPLILFFSPFTAFYELFSYYLLGR